METSGLGHRMLGDAPDINKCYEGDIVPEGKSWSNFEKTYTSATSGKLKADFGDLLKVKAGGEGGKTINSKVILADLDGVTLKNLFFDPSSTCFKNNRDEYTTGKTDSVIVKALRAKRVEITQLDKNSAKLEVNVPFMVNGIGANIEAGGGRESGGTEFWDGTNLYFAHQIKNFKTTLTNEKFSPIPSGGRTQKRSGGCTFSLDSASVISKTWEGALNCLGSRGSSKNKLKGSLGEYDGYGKDGVTRVVAVNDIGAAQYEVEIITVTVEDLPR